MLPKLSNKILKFSAVNIFLWEVRPSLILSTLIQSIMFLPAFVPGYVKQPTSVMMPQQKLGNKHLCKFSTQREKKVSESLSQVDNESLWGTLL